MATTITQLTPDVTDALQGRTDITTTQYVKYIQRALREITISYPFEELRVTGPNVSLTANVATYATTLFTTSGEPLAMVESWPVFIDYPSNTVKHPLDYKTPKAIESMTSPTATGVPTYWTRYGSNFFIAPVPDQPYLSFMRYQRQHPFPANDGTDPILVPDDWMDIVAYAAAQRIAVIKRWNEQAKALHDMLYGDPEYVASEGKRGRPGLIAARLMQVERDQRLNSRRIGISVPRYTAR